MVQVALIYGSTRPGRFCDTVAGWAAKLIDLDGRFTLAMVDPAGVVDGVAASDSKISERVRAAEAFVVVTPEYNHGYPAPLKALIDSMGAEWHAKPVSFVSYGGVSGGLRAVEQLRQVFAEVHATTVRDSVSLAGAWERFDAEGRLLEPERTERSMKLMLTQLHWWAVALRDARKVVAYPKAGYG